MASDIEKTEIEARIAELEAEQRETIKSLKAKRAAEKRRREGLSKAVAEMDEELIQLRAQCKRQAK